MAVTLLTYVSLRVVSALRRAAFFASRFDLIVSFNLALSALTRPSNLVKTATRGTEEICEAEARERIDLKQFGNLLFLISC